MSKIAIIPARGGSKRIPKKNIKNFLGKPIIGYSIQAALESKLFDEVMVSTDDEEIAEVARNYGANVPFMRSKQNSNDLATTYDVIEEVITTYQQQGIIFDKFCCIYACAPFVEVKILTKALEQLEKQRLDSIFPVMKYSFPIQRALRRKDLKIAMIAEENLNIRSQDLEEHYHDAGQFYWCITKEILRTKQIYTKNTGGILVSELEAQDIDNENDWKLAEFKYKLKHAVSK